jgi:hypothetical protein
MADDGRGNEARSVVDDDPDAGGGLRPYLLMAFRRLLVLIVLAATLTAIASLVLGLLMGASLTRSLASGFYLLGTFWRVSGFIVGNRGPLPLYSDLGAPLFGSRFVRWATPEERNETINMSAIYVVLGFVLILFGFAADTRYSLF